LSRYWPWPRKPKGPRGPILESYGRARPPAGEQPLSWQPRWELPPEPIRDDEEEVKKFFLPFVPARIRDKAWNDLKEWQKESWRREYRDNQLDT